ncbi:SigE family RNA polymerase sigma factor [Kitasatospora sp. NPDC048540]|uniref:SigE family RNA polymerase sigma factor n=1 Tax=unclassified Kitasatospora TaxID=2633591 RepID=UPI00053B7658|nr:SigE family RNA polymerase sigma factor [Kitasatospora sp. MBT63]
MDDAALEFEEFAGTRARRLFQVAYLMCGDWHQAQDLVQTTLAKMFSIWGRLRRGRDEPGLDAYARKVMLRYYLSHRRLRKSTEVVLAELPDSPGGAVTPDLRLALTEALRLLPPRNRAVVVLRYLEDRSIEEVADLLDLSPAAVKSLNTRSLAKLRGILGEDRELMFLA